MFYPIYNNGRRELQETKPISDQFLPRAKRLVDSSSDYLESNEIKTIYGSDKGNDHQQPWLLGACHRPALHWMEQEYLILKGKQ